MNERQPMIFILPMWRTLKLLQALSIQIEEIKPPDWDIVITNQPFFI